MSKLIDSNLKPNSRLIKSLVGKNVMRSVKTRNGLQSMKYVIKEIKEIRYFEMGLDLEISQEQHSWSIVLERKSYKHRINLGHKVALLKSNVLKAFADNNCSLIENPNKITIIV
jgi:hypothetical protein